MSSTTTPARTRISVTTSFGAALERCRQEIADQRQQNPAYEAMFIDRVNRANDYAHQLGWPDETVVHLRRKVPSISSIWMLAMLDHLRRYGPVMSPFMAHSARLARPAAGSDRANRIEYDTTAPHAAIEITRQLIHDTRQKSGYEVSNVEIFEALLCQWISRNGMAHLLPDDMRQPAVMGILLDDAI
ncbi:hypothetical protein SAMN02745857_01043 [Andreprevotia lacus DSM 23236]|jgi:hypothetical protein|uniref:Uncharacterized protein n=1 Tax=Andreprevotia lacus DSM 23236 TaxID=1121001 RepID=A0A1W1XB69_9NEIS|nr:hypothetical protein [Andreprevotia lacus]SMC20771.1 hypothetical protein SAMN02745857_01043 [Andreprevotia lacus DSM 23236]